MIKKVTSDDFQVEVLDAQEPVLVDFSATWCGPCKMAEPLIEKVAEAFEGKARVVKVDIDESPELASEFQVRGVPTFVFMKEGKEIERKVGLGKSNTLNESFTEILNSLL